MVLLFPTASPHTSTHGELSSGQFIPAWGNNKWKCKPTFNLPMNICNAEVPHQANGSCLKAAWFSTECKTGWWTNVVMSGTCHVDDAAGGPTYFKLGLPFSQKPENTWILGEKSFCHFASRMLEKGCHKSSVIAHASDMIRVPTLSQCDSPIVRGIFESISGEFSLYLRRFYPTEESAVFPPGSPIFKAAIHEIVRWKPGLLDGHLEGTVYPMTPCHTSARSPWVGDGEKLPVLRRKIFHSNRIPTTSYEVWPQHVWTSLSGPKIFLRWPGPTFTTRKPNIFIARLRRPDSVMFLQYLIISIHIWCFVHLY